MANHSTLQDHFVSILFLEFLYCIFFINTGLTGLFMPLQASPAGRSGQGIASWTCNRVLLLGQRFDPTPGALSPEISLGKRLTVYCLWMGFETGGLVSAHTLHYTQL